MTCRVRVLYFAALRDLCGRGEELVELPEQGRTVADLAAQLEELHPALGGRLSGVRFAVNESFVRDEDIVTDGDVVALIPPVSGG